MNSSKACSEVLEILKYIPLEDYNKIPSSFINDLERNASNNSTFTYNAALPFSEQKISGEAKSVLAHIAKEWWS